MKSRSHSDVRIGAIFVIIIMAINFNLFFTQSVAPENMFPHIYPALNLSKNNNFRSDLKIQGKILSSMDSTHLANNITPLTNEIVNYALQTNNSDTRTLSELSYKVNFQNKFGIVFFLDDNFYSQILNQLSIAVLLNDSSIIYIQNNNLPFINTTNLKISPLGSKTIYNLTAFKAFSISNFNNKVSILNSDLNQGGVDGFFIWSIGRMSVFGSSLTASNSFQFEEYIQLDNKSLSSLLLSSSSNALMNKLTSKFTTVFLGFGLNNLIITGNVFSELFSLNQDKSLLLEQLTILQLIIDAFSVLLIISVLWATHFRRRFIESAFIRNEYIFFKRITFYTVESFII